MAKKVENIEEVMDVEYEDTTEVVETPEKKGLLSKIGAGVKKHGPKIAAVAIPAVAGFILGTVLRKKADEEGEYDYVDGDWEFTDLSESDTTVETEKENNG